MFEVGKVYQDGYGAEFKIDKVDEAIGLYAVKATCIKAPVFLPEDVGKTSEFTREGQFLMDRTSDSDLRPDPIRDVGEDAQECATVLDFIGGKPDEPFPDVPTTTQVLRQEARLQQFLYLLVRDHIPFGTLERILQNIRETQGKDVQFSEGAQAAYAMHVAQQLLSDGDL